MPVTDVADLTGFPAILGHRVVTLHPKVHGGILADRDDPEHRADMEAYGIEPIDLVVANLYPFSSEPVDRADRHRRAGDGAGRGQEPRSTSASSPTPPTTTRCSPSCGPTARSSPATRRRLARDAFAHTAAYDAADRRPGSTPAGPSAPTPRPPATAPPSCPPPSSHPRPRARCCATARTPTRSAPATPSGGEQGWWDTADPARRQGDVLPQRLRHRGGVAAGPRRWATTRPRSSSSTPTRAAWPWPTTSPRPTPGPTSATRSRPSAASWR